MTEEERAALLVSLQTTEADLAADDSRGVDSDMLAAELRAVRNAVLVAEAQEEETPIAALKKGIVGPTSV